MTAKTPTPQGISALLRKAGWDRAKPRRSARISAGAAWTDGYRVTRYDASTVQVEHKGTGWNGLPVLGKIAAYLEAEGYRVDRGAGTYLTVTARED
jgi:hypothetical protein